MIWYILGGAVVYLAGSYGLYWWIMLDKGRSRGGMYGIDKLLFPLAPLVTPMIIAGIGKGFIKRIFR